MLSSISISPSFKASKIVSSVFVPMVSGTSLLKGVWSSTTKATRSELYNEIPEIWRLYLNYSSPGSPFWEHNDYCHDGGTSDSFPSFPETRLGNGLAPFEPG